MEFHLSHPPRPHPTCRLIKKALEPNHRLVTRPSHLPGQQLRNVPLQMVIGGKANDVLQVPLLRRLVELRFGKAASGAEDYLLAEPLLAFKLEQQQFLPSLGPVEVARP